MNKLGEPDSVSSDAVIEAVRGSNPGAIALVSRLLENAHMRRRISQLAARRPKVSPDQDDLFADYSGVRQFIRIDVDRDGDHSEEWKKILKATLQELNEWLAADRRSSSTRRQRNPGMAKLVRDLSRIAKGNMSLTVEQALALRDREGGDDE
jgi:hypothetical protein